MPTRTEIIMRVNELHDTGMHPTDIAHYMNIPKHMIEEIIDHRCVLEGMQ